MGHQSKVFGHQPFRPLSPRPDRRPFGGMGRPAGAPFGACFGGSGLFPLLSRRGCLGEGSWRGQGERGGKTGGRLVSLGPVPATSRGIADSVFRSRPLDVCPSLERIFPPPTDGDMPARPRSHGVSRPPVSVETHVPRPRPASARGNLFRRHGSPPRGLFQVQASLFATVLSEPFRVLPVLQQRPCETWNLFEPAQKNAKTSCFR
mmetsp:Transcript_21051/g.54475  ORF Transcript_21051/g.54475 Transcript_21051/m.54475 type:complete len:205 (+) Transcript_21051:2249-2863(+)